MVVEYGRILPSRALLAAHISTLGLGQVIPGRALSQFFAMGSLLLVVLDRKLVGEALRASEFRGSE